MAAMKRCWFKEAPFKLWTLLAVSLIFSLDLCVAQRLVSLQKSPLVRVEGHHTTIQCDVSGYQGSLEQDFGFSIFRPDKPQLKIQIISTHDSGFSYAKYGTRVRNKEIYIERLAKDSVLLHITDLKPDNQGLYECFTPNTDVAYWGSYSATTNLTVIPDTLSATSVPQTLSKVEGDSLELLCEVSKQTLQHTHVAVSWYLQKGGQNLKVISLTQELILEAGEVYKRRQALGDVRLDKIGATSYKLTIDKLQTSDEGEFYCEAREWIQDPDNAWYDLNNKGTDKTVVNIKSIGKEFRARIEATPASINVGASLEVVCIVEAQNTPDRHFSVTWFLKNKEIIRLGPNAVPVFHGEYFNRENLGKVKVNKKSNSEYLLKIYQVQMEDGGVYYCQVEESEQISSGAFSTKKSEEVTVTVERPQANLNVVISHKTVQLLEGDSLEITCDIQSTTGSHGQLSVDWQFLSSKGETSKIISMDQDGTQVTAESYRKRDVRMARVQSDAFSLGIYNLMTSDSGQYTCKVVESEAESKQLTGEYVSNSTVLTIEPLENNFKVTAMTRTPAVKYNDTFKLQCVIQPRYPSHVIVSVIWKFQPNSSTDSYNLVTFTPKTAIEWGDKVDNFKTKTSVVKTVSNIFRLSVSRASHLEAGKFLCMAQLWVRENTGEIVMKASKTSNILQVKVTPPVSKLQVNKEIRNIEKRINDIVEVECRISAQTQNDSQFAVTWLFRKAQDSNTGDENLLQTDRNNIIQYYGELLTDTQKKMKFQGEKTSNGVYKLIVQKTDVTDSGRYHCRVEEWLSDPNNVWYKIGEDMSGVTDLQVLRAGVKLQLSKTNSTVTTIEDDVEIKCNIESQLQRQSQFSVMWYYNQEQEPDSKGISLLKTDHNNILIQYPKSQMGAQKMKFQSIKVSNSKFKLIIQKPEPRDSGVYYCRVEEWVLNAQNEWYIQGDDLSGLTKLEVQAPESRLQVYKTEVSISVQSKELFHLHCNITSQTKDDSQFAVSWFTLKANQGAHEKKNQEVLKINHNSVFEYGAEGMKDRLQLERLSNRLYSLTVHNANTGDSGIYYCDVEEWIQSVNNTWYKLGEAQSGLAMVTVETIAPTLHSNICASESMFYFIFIYPFIIFVALIALSIYFYLRPKKPKRSVNDKIFWTPIEKIMGEPKLEEDLTLK
ncbi:immunoglobulin superfamily member 3 isoform X1 [Callorhinchus milii]|uniref:immunoglobulin superfamily member 3 isoform X1 n=1 Tax=Callorhinchus milii TaxID=7868 RepID=UPI001C3FB935|nr:immunoglobulin superfamily member 3 isoform X1 [Callorhinchus milii]